MALKSQPHVLAVPSDSTKSPPPTFPKDVLVLLLRWVTEQLRHDKMEVVLHNGKKTGRYRQCRRDAYIQFCREEKFAAKYNVRTYRELRCTAVCA